MYLVELVRLPERLVQDEFRLKGLQVFERCSCGKVHREWYYLQSVGGFAGIEYEFARYMALRGNPTWKKTSL